MNSFLTWTETRCVGGYSRLQDGVQLTQIHWELQTNTQISLLFHSIHVIVIVIPCLVVQFNLTLPEAVNEYYDIKAKVRNKEQHKLESIPNDASLAQCHIACEETSTFTITRVTHDSLLLDISANKLDGHQEQLPPLDRMPIPMDLIESWHKHSWRDVLLIFPLSHIYKKKRPEWTNCMRNPCARWSSGEPIKRQKHWFRQKLTKSEQKQMKLNQDGVR